MGATLLDVIRGGEEALADVARQARSGQAVAVEHATFAPLLDPPSVRDFLTYEQHLAELAGHVPEEWYEKPLFYFSNPAAIVGPYDEVPIPPSVTQYDYELEIAAVVGRAGADLTPEQAQRHILGYTIMNDWSARDLQVHEFKFPMGPSKSKDGAITLGPWLVTADEVADRFEEDRLALTTSVWLNGVRVGGDNSANMAWSFAELVAFASRGTVVRPGDVLGSGTCGTGCLAEIKRTLGASAPDWLKPGDVVRIEVEKLGMIENTLAPGPAPTAIPPGRRRIHAAPLEAGSGRPDPAEEVHP
ncbi:fumarylacetoacetate hydrolase family protein [Nocardia sp. NBC_01377]|uniref:fumarylacetoacetate hydrolase family protein n=1 Tax=Nocardia sp. NBC_01377 TaxID=2903595 RepID=UPI003255AEFB